MHPQAPRPFDLDVHRIPERPASPHTFISTCASCRSVAASPVTAAAPLGSAGDESVGRLVAKALAFGGA